jgi:hypothetical protein
MQKLTSLPKPIWIGIGAIAICVTLLGGNPDAVNWKAYIQLPGSFVVVYFGWFIGPLAIFMSPFVVDILTILINTATYYLVIRLFLFFRGKVVK